MNMICVDCYRAAGICDDCLDAYLRDTEEAEWWHGTQPEGGFVYDEKTDGPYVTGL